MSTIIDERYELSLNRITEISENPEVDEAFRGYFSFVARFILIINTPSDDKEYNKMLYEDIVGDNYENSYANPKFCSRLWNKMTCSVNESTSEKSRKTGISDESDECSEHKYDNKNLIATIETTNATIQPTKRIATSIAV